MEQTRGRRLLAEWMAENNRSQRWLAAAIETSQQNVSRWLAGGEMSLGFAVAMQRVTGIDVESWTQPDDATQTQPAQVNATVQP